MKGPRGSLVKSFKHLALDIYMVDKETIKVRHLWVIVLIILFTIQYRKMRMKTKTQVEKWFGKKKQIAAVRTVCSHITNMFKGVTQVSGQYTYYIHIYIFVPFLRIFYPGLLVQDEGSVCPLPNQLRHHRGRHTHWGSQLSWREVHQEGKTLKDAISEAKSNMEVSNYLGETI